MAEGELYSCEVHKSVTLAHLETSVPTRTDLSVQVRIFFLNSFLYGFFQKYRFLDFCTDFFF